MRLFIALEIPPLLQDEISTLVRPLRTIMEGRFMPRENRHITLAFIGNVPGSALPSVEEALYAAAESIGAINLKPERLGKFGRSNDATFWLGFAEDPNLLELVDRMRSELRKRDISFDDKRFLPHATLARRARIPKGELPPLPFPNPSFAARVALFKSTLSSEGASYEEICGVDLPRPFHNASIEP